MQNRFCTAQSVYCADYGCRLFRENTKKFTALEMITILSYEERTINLSGNLMHFFIGLNIYRRDLYMIACAP